MSYSYQKLIEEKENINNNSNYNDNNTKIESENTKLIEKEKEPESNTNYFNSSSQTIQSSWASFGNPNYESYSYNQSK